MMKKNAPIYIIIVVAIALMMVHLMRINYDNLAWDINRTPYVGIMIAVVILIGALYRLKKTPKV